jgi:hypothetical protein
MIRKKRAAASDAIMLDKKATHWWPMMVIEGLRDNPSFEM